MWRMQGGYGRVVWFPTFDADNHLGGDEEGRIDGRPSSRWLLSINVASDDISDGRRTLDAP